MRPETPGHQGMIRPFGRRVLVSLLFLLLADPVLALVGDMRKDPTEMVKQYLMLDQNGARLDAPKGLALSDDHFFVADIDSVKVFRKRTRKLERRIDLSGFGAKSLTGAALHPSGALFVSDPPTDRIFRIDLESGDRVSVFVDSPDLGRPRGLIVNPKNGNLMVAPEAGIVAVLDWELAHIGDPMRDLGWLCTNSWRFGAHHLPVGGFGERAELFAGYEAVSGRRIDPDAVRYWEVFGSYWWAIGCLTMAGQYRDHATRSVERPGIGRRSSECQVDCVNLLLPGPVTQPTEPPPENRDELLRTEELLESVRDFLREDVMTATAGRIRFLARVAANSLDIVRREFAAGPQVRAAEHGRLEALLGSRGSLSELRWRLVERLRDGSLALDAPGLATHLRQTVVDQVAIDQPGYAGLASALSQGAD